MTSVSTDRAPTRPPIGALLCEALGVDPNHVTRLVIECDVETRGLARVTTTEVHWVASNSVDDGPFMEIEHRYELREVS